MKYKAFISYSHEIDENLATKIQRKLIRVITPWYRLRSMRVFRDNSNLSANSGLWSSIEKAIVESEYFILLASEDASKSIWVEKEIVYWLENKPPENIILVATKGELVWNDSQKNFDSNLSTAIPKKLNHIFKEEPRYVDFRFLNNQVKRSDDKVDSKFNKGIIDIAAVLLGMERNELHSNEKKILRRNIRTAIALIIILIALALGLFIEQRILVRQNNEIRFAALTKEFDLVISKKQYITSLLFAVEAIETSQNFEALSNLKEALSKVPNKRFLGTHQKGDSLVFTPDGEKIIGISGHRDKNSQSGNENHFKMIWSLEGKRLDESQISVDQEKYALLKADGVSVFDPPVNLKVANSGFQIQGVDFKWVIERIGTGKKLFTSNEYGADRLRDFQVSDDGKRYLVVNESRGTGAGIWDFYLFGDNGYRYIEKRSMLDFIALNADISYGVFMSPDSGNLIAWKCEKSPNEYGENDSWLLAWNRNGNKIKLPTEMPTCIQAAGFANKDSGLFIVDSGGIFRNLVRDGKNYIPLPNTDLGNLSYANFSPRGKRLVTVDKEGAWLWNVEDIYAHEVAVFPFEKYSKVIKIARSHEGYIVFTYDKKKVLKNWRLSKSHRKEIWRKGNVNLTSVSPDGQKIMVLNSNGFGQVLDIDGNVIGEIKIPFSTSSLGASADGDHFFISGEKCEKAIVDANNFTYQLYQCGFLSQNGKMLLSLGTHTQDYGVIYKIGDDGSLSKLPKEYSNGFGNWGDTIDTYFSPNGEYIVFHDVGIANYNQDKFAMHLWKIDGSDWNVEMHTSFNPLKCIFSKDSISLLLWEENEPKAFYWNNLENKVELEISSPIVEADFSINNNHFLTAHKNGWIQIWSRKGELVFSFQGHAGPIDTAYFLLDGIRFVTVSSNNGKAKIWTTDVDEMLMIAKKKLSYLRDFTTDEIKQYKNLLSKKTQTRAKQHEIEIRGLDRGYSRDITVRKAKTQQLIIRPRRIISDDQKTSEKIGIEKTETTNSISNQKLPEKTITPSTNKLRLRSKPMTISKAQYKAMLRKKGFFDSDYNPKGMGIAKQFNPIDINGDEVVVEEVTGLMWQKSGLYEVKYSKINDYLKKLRANKFAGFSDWRLPNFRRSSFFDRNKGYAIR